MLHRTTPLAFVRYHEGFAPVDLVARLEFVMEVIKWPVVVRNLQKEDLAAHRRTCDF